jgi:hypothetical protein
LGNAAPDTRSLASSRQPRGDLPQRVGDDVVVSPQAAALGVDDPDLAELLEVVAEGRLADVERRWW